MEHFLTLKHLLWLAASSILLWPLRALWGWLRHCFWIGFKANFSAAMKKGGPLTPEEKAAIKVQVEAQIDAEVQAKIRAVADPLGIKLPNANTDTIAVGQDGQE